MSTGSRIPREIAPFIDYMEATDDWQKDTDPATTNPRHENWSWTAAESTQWSDFRQLADTLNDTYKVKKKRSGDNYDKFTVLIKDVVEYEKDHKLLDKISIAPMPPAVIDDFEIFNVKRGTPLEDTTPTDSTVVPGQPQIEIVGVKHLTHELEVTNPAHSGFGKGPGIKDIQVWRAVVAAGADEPPASAYAQAGDAERGKFRSVFDDADKRKDAYYKARMKGTNGKYGEFCAPKMETII